MKNDGRVAEPIMLDRDRDIGCPVCGLGGAFVVAQQYEVCARCGWVDDPDAYAAPDRTSETNEESLHGAMATWPERLVRRLADSPTSTFRIAIRDDEIGGYDYVIGGLSLRELFPASAKLMSLVGAWTSPQDAFESLLSGSPDSATGRSRLYGCHLCADPYEQSLTADVHVGADRVVWSRIGFEDYDIAGQDGWRLNVRNGPVGFAFDAEAYRRTLLAARSAHR